jgi:hypothetical protein
MSRRRFFEYVVKISGQAVVDFETTENVVADNALDASRQLRKKFKGMDLNILDPKVTTKIPKVKVTRTEQVTRYTGKPNN